MEFCVDIGHRFSVNFLSFAAIFLIPKEKQKRFNLNVKAKISIGSNSYNLYTGSCFTIVWNEFGIDFFMNSIFSFTSKIRHSLVKKVSRTI